MRVSAIIGCRRIKYTAQPSSGLIDTHTALILPGTAVVHSCNLFELSYKLLVVSWREHRIVVNMLSAPLKDWSRATYEDEEDELACSQTPLAEPTLKVRAVECVCGKAHTKLTLLFCH